MDTIPLPRRKDKKGHIIRASKKQSEVLLDLFAQNPVASPESVKSVSEETGLPTKWINSWFIRQRRKARDVEATVQSNMSTDVIDKFKTEYQDPILVDPRDDDVTRSNKSLITKKVHSGRQKRIKTEHEDIENTSPIVIPSPPSKSLLPPVTGDRMENPSSAPLSSTFVLREMVPRMWAPPGLHHPPPLELSDLNPSTTTPATQDQCLSQFSAYSAPQVQLSAVRTVLQPTPHKHNNVLPTSRVLPAIHVPEPTPNGVQGGISEGSHIFVSDPRRNHPSYRHHYQPHRTSNLGPGRPTDHKAQVILNPLPTSIFATGLASASYPLAYRNPLPVDNGNWLPEPIAPPVYVADRVSNVVPVAALSTQLPQMPPQQDYYSLLDPSTAPLKYLTMLGPLEGWVRTNGVSAEIRQDVVFDRLLDENMAQIDPFQAAMGLVFLSRLGLEWEY